MQESLLSYYQQKASPNFISSYWAVCKLLHRKKDLEQLIAWATRKNAHRVRQSYSRLLIDTEQHLWQYQRLSAWAVLSAKFAVYLNEVINPPSQKRFTVGYARQYKRV